MRHKYLTSALPTRLLTSKLLLNYPIQLELFCFVLAIMIGTSHRLLIKWWHFKNTFEIVMALFDTAHTSNCKELEFVLDLPLIIFYLDFGDNVNDT